MTCEEAIRKMDSTTRRELHMLCQEYLKTHSSSALRQISAIMKNWGSDEDDPKVLVKSL